MKHKLPPPSETDALKQDLRNAQDALLLAYQRFDLADAPELVEACIYEINACRTRVGYLYRLVQGSCGSPVVREESVWA